jgi:hypothetical protein
MDNGGEELMKLPKTVQVKIFHPGNKRSRMRIFRAGAGKGYTAKGVDMVLASRADWIEKSLAGHEYKLVPIGPFSFNFVHVGERAEEAA